MKLIGTLALIFVGMTLINRILEGQFITAADTSVLNTMTLIKTAEIGFFTIPVLNLEFFGGIQRLVMWDYSFFGGNAQIIQYFLYSFTFVVGFLLFTIIIGLIYQIFRPR